MAKKTVDKKRKKKTTYQKAYDKKTFLYGLSLILTFVLVCLIETIRCYGVSMKKSNKRSQKTVFEGPSSQKTRGRCGRQGCWTRIVRWGG